MTIRMAVRERLVNGGILGGVPPSGTTDDLLVLPVVALLDEPRDAHAVRGALAAHGIDVSRERAEDVLGRASALGLAHVSGYEAGAARYVVTPLGQRAATALLALEPAVNVRLPCLVHSLRARRISDWVASAGNFEVS